MERHDERLIALNNLLKQEERYQEVLEIEKLQVKKYISVKELTILHKMSKTSQQNYRERIHDPLPYHQKVAGGNITYIVKEIEQWLENQHK